MALSTRSSSPKCGSGRIHKSRPKGLNQVELGPNPMTTRRFRTQTNLRSDVEPVSNVPERRRLKPSQSQADRPWGATQPPPTSGRNPEHPLKGGGQMAATPGRPAGLGEAGRLHLASSGALPWHERQGQLPYLRTTDAQLSTDHRVV